MTVEKKYVGAVVGAAIGGGTGVMIGNSVDEFDPIVTGLFGSALGGLGGFLLGSYLESVDDDETSEEDGKKTLEPESPLEEALKSNPADPLGDDLEA